MLKKFGFVIDRAIEVGVILACIVILLQTVAVAGNSLLGLVFNRWITGVEAFAEWGMLWVTFLAAAWILKIEGHVSVDILTKKFSPNFVAVLNLTIYVVSIVGWMIIAVMGTVVTYDYLVRGLSDYFKRPGFPLATILIIIPLGSFLLSLQCVRKAHAYWQALFKRGEVSGQDMESKLES